MPKREIETKYYLYSQNNSGGYYEEDEKCGIGQTIAVEAVNDEDARIKINNIVEDFSSYCNCCGERWDTYSSDQTAENLDGCIEFANRRKFYKEEVMYVHNMNGTIDKYEII